MAESGTPIATRHSSQAASAEVLAAVAEMAVQLRHARSRVTEEMSAVVTAGIDEVADPRVRQLMATSIESNISTLADVWEHHIPVERIQPPTATLEFALLLAQRGISVATLARTFAISQNDLLDVCFDLLGGLALSEGVRTRAMRHVSDVLFRYSDWMGVQLREAYDAEQKLWLADHGTMFASLVHTLLAGTDADESLFEGETGYVLDQVHLGAVVFTDEEEAVTTNRVLRRCAQAVGAVGPPLTTAIDRHLTWAWFPRGRAPVRPVDLDEVRAAVDGTGCTVALGMSVAGTDGFRRTHEQAVAAYRLQRRSADGTRAVIAFTEDAVAVIARLADDPIGTRLWVTETLGPLARNRPSEARLRETLLTFIRTGGSYAQSAGRLNVHANTVKYRVRRALELRGRPIREDRLALELALEVVSYLGESMLSEP